VILGVNQVAHVARPPAKPRLLYDGECKFCTLWMHRWQLATGDFVECLPFQDPRGAAQFPEITRTQFDTAVQLVLPDGAVFSAAHAVCRSLACNPEEQWLLELYQHSPVFVRIAETAYRFVARHRKFFSATTWLLWGKQLEPPRQNLVRWIFLRSLGLVYLLAFLSLWPQITGLVGSQGRAPVAITLTTAKINFAAQNIGADRCHLMPTLCWFSTSDGFLNLQCFAGAALAVLLVLGVAPAPCLFLLWLIYLSLTTVCAVLPDLQWANLLLETGLLAVVFAPLQLLPCEPARETPPSRIALWLLRWLLFRLMFAAGCLKSLGGDAAWLKPLSSLAMFSLDYVLPFFIFLPRRPRQLACGTFVLLQIVLLPSSSHVWFNVLTLLLCLTLLDDAALQSILPKAWQRGLPGLQKSSPRRQRRWATAILLGAMVLAGCAGYTQFFKLVGLYMPGPEPVVAVNHWLRPLRAFNTYQWPP